MKIRLLRLSVFMLMTIMFFGCCENCEKERKECEAKVEETSKSIKEILSNVDQVFIDKFKAFRDIKLPVFLGKTRNSFQQYLHIEGGIENPFIILGKFKSVMSTDKKTCTIEELELEVLSTRRGSSVPIKNYQFDVSQQVKLYKKSGQLIMELTIIPGNIDTKMKVHIEGGKINVMKDEILDIHVTKKGIADDPLKISIGDEHIEIMKCCGPIICKSIFKFP